MIWLALRLSLHNRTRLAVTLVGVIFSSYSDANRSRSLYRDDGECDSSDSPCQRRSLGHLQGYTKLRFRQAVSRRSREAGISTAGCALGEADYAYVGFFETSQRSPGAS